METVCASSRLREVGALEKKKRGELNKGDIDLLARKTD
jgi:hypothetical protein